MPPPRRRSTGLRRPRVAGLAPAARPDTVPVTEVGRRRLERGTSPAVDASAPADAPPAPDAPTVAVPTTAGSTPATPTVDPPAPGAETRVVPHRLTVDPPVAPGVEVRPDPAGSDLTPTAVATPDRPLWPLLVALGVAVLLAVTFAVLDLTARSAPSAANTALSDVGATAAVAAQLGDALETVYSYDFARLDENERAARAVITPDFAADFDALFGQVRELAPDQQAVVSATVTVSAVKSIEGDRAELVAFLDQRATRAADAQQLEAAGRLTVVGQREDGIWKIAEVRPN